MSDGDGDGSSKPPNNGDENKEIPSPNESKRIFPPIVDLVRTNNPLTVMDMLHSQDRHFSEMGLEEEDESDAWPGLGGGGGGSRSRNGGRSSFTPYSAGPKMPVSRESDVYNMNHKQRGVAYIFNHKNFHPRLGLKVRNGTDADRDNLKATLRSLGFEIRAFEDLPYNELERLLEEASLEDHSDSDCILISVLSHGELGILYAYDSAYKPERLWANFNAEKCRSLAGKPKLFFIQACQGDQLDSGVTLVNHQTETDSNGLSYKIPSHADFLIGYSTIPGFYSWRNTTAGSWFIQALCYVLQREGRSRDLLSMMTRVARKVAFDFQSNTPDDYLMHKKKQIPCITTMLTRDVYFTEKATPESGAPRRP